MKKLVYSLILLAFTLPSFAQVINKTPEISYISVTGSAEMEIIPDEIYIGFTAKEYKRGSQDVLLEEIHRDVLHVLKAYNIDPSNLQIENFYGSRWVSKRKIKDLVANKKYTLKLTHINIIDKLLDDLDSINIEDIHLEKITNSKLDEYREQVKIDATKAAKRKATLMAEGLGQTIGKAFEVIELNSDYPYIPNYQGYENTYNYVSKVSFESLDQSSYVNFKTIKLSYLVEVKFILN